MDEISPLISIITVTYQAAKTLEETIKSVLTQESIYEYIIIDGGSTDSTVEIIQRYEQSFSYWISEPDSGIYDAMNKAVLEAKGTWIYFLGADDQLLPGVLSDLKDLFKNNANILLYGNIMYDHGEVFRSQFSYKTLLHNTIHHQSAFYKRQLFDKFSFNSSLRIIADYELNLHIYKEKLPSQYIDKTIAKCTEGGSSYDVKLSLFETNLVRKSQVSKTINFLLKNVLTVKYFISYVLLRKI